MRIDSDQVNDEVLGNLEAGQPLCEDAQHLQFTRGQPGMKQRKRRGRCRRWGCESRLWERFLIDEVVFWGHRLTLGPGAVKGLLPQLLAHGCDGELVHRLRKWWERRPDGFA